MTRPTCNSTPALSRSPRTCAPRETPAGCARPAPDRAAAAGSCAAPSGSHPFGPAPVKRSSAKISRSTEPNQPDFSFSTRSLTSSSSVQTSAQSSPTGAFASSSTSRNGPVCAGEGRRIHRPEMEPPQPLGVQIVEILVEPLGDGHQLQPRHRLRHQMRLRLGPAPLVLGQARAARCPRVHQVDRRHVHLTVIDRPMHKKLRADRPALPSQTACGSLRPRTARPAPVPRNRAAGTARIAAWSVFLIPQDLPHHLVLERLNDQACASRCRSACKRIIGHLQQLVIDGKSAFRPVKGQLARNGQTRPQNDTCAPAP